jgi:hypothetical protein
MPREFPCREWQPRHSYSARLAEPFSDFPAILVGPARARPKSNDILPGNFSRAVP